MPKIKDLGIKVIPETMRPPEAGGGAGCGASVQAAICPAFSHCGCTIRIFTPWCGWCSYHHSCWCSFVSPVAQQQCPLQSVVCQVGTQGGGGCGPASPVCGGSIIDGTIVQQPPELTRESISALKEQLQQQIAKLDEHAKTLKK